MDIVKYLPNKKNYTGTKIDCKKSIYVITIEKPGRRTQAVGAVNLGVVPTRDLLEIARHRLKTANIGSRRAAITLTQLENTMLSLERLGCE